MPEFVETLLRKKTLTIYSSLFTSYVEDVYKYSSLSEAKYLRFVIETAPLFAGATITYENLKVQIIEARR